MASAGLGHGHARVDPYKSCSQKADTMARRQEISAQGWAWPKAGELLGFGYQISGLTCDCEVGCEGDRVWGVEVKERALDFLSQRRSFERE